MNLDNNFNIIRKDDNNISFNLNLKTNGNYNIIHQYDSNYVGLQVKNAKLKQLKTWMNATFTYGKPPNGENNINKAYQLYDSKYKDLMIELLDWLDDVRDN